jgi:hypothetical protein
MPESPSQSQACKYLREKTAVKLFVSIAAASIITSNVPTVSLNRFMLATLINLPAVVKGNTQIAQQTVPAKAINIPADAIVNLLNK